MNLKIYLFITLFIAIACAGSVDARKASRRRKTHHHTTSHKHSSSSHHNEGGLHKSESDHHATTKQHSQELHSKHVASTHVEAPQNNHKADPPANTHQLNRQSAENDFAEGFTDGFAAGLAAVRRQRRRRTTTVAPTTTTTIPSTTTIKPCSNNTSMPGNSLVQDPAEVVVNCAASSATISTPLQSINEQP